MPITFAQPDPIAPAVTAGAAAGQMELQAWPSIAAVYESAARLRAQGYGGSGGGSSGQMNHNIQVLPSGSSDSTYANNAQANREQQALDLGFEADNDPVANHIQMQEQFRTQQQQQAQAAQALLLQQYNQPNNNGQNQQSQQPPQPPPITFTPEDQQQLNESGQAMADVTTKYQQGDIGLDAYYSMRQPAQQQYDAMIQKQRAAQAQQQQQQDQAQLDTSRKQAGMQVATGNAIATHAATLTDVLRAAGVPDGKLAMDRQGKLYDPTDHRARMAVDIWKENKKAETATAATKQKADAAAEEAENKHVIQDRALAHAEVTTEAGKDKNGAQNTIDLAKVEARRQQLTQARRDDVEQRNLVKNAVPQVRAAYVAHLDSLPQGDDGKPDYNRSTNNQLAKVGQLLADPKAVGVMKKDATEGLAKIRRILQDRAEASRALSQKEIVPGSPGIPPEPPRGVPDIPSHIFYHDATRLTDEERKRLTSKEALPDEIEWDKSAHGGNEE